MKTTVSISIDLALEPQDAFDALVEEMSLSLGRDGVTLEAGPAGQVRSGGREVGQFVVLEPGKVVALRWHPPDWNPKETIEIELRFEPIEGGTHVTVELRGWSGVTGSARDAAGWFAGEVATPLLRASLPERLADWLTDRRARWPSGAAARGVYRDPLYHYPNFKVILAELKLTPDDYLIEIGCGGGAMLKDALKSGCRAAAVDHSFDMVRLAQEVNADAVAAGRLVVEHASADRLPFRDATFTRGAMTGVLGFLPDAVTALRELWRVLRPGGRLVILGSDPALRGTPAAPEPIASRLHFYNDEQFRQLAIDAGFAEASVVRRDLLPYAREAGVPEEHLPLFAKQPAPFLIARKA